MATANDVKCALNTWKRREFQYGDSDCCRFVAHVAGEIIGKDLMAGFAYDDEVSAYSLVADHGGLEGLVTAALGVEPSNYYGNGDPVLVNLPIIGDAMGVALSGHAVCLTQVGMVRIKQRYIIKGWQICPK